MRQKMKLCTLHHATYKCVNFLTNFFNRFEPVKFAVWVWFFFGHLKHAYLRQSNFNFLVLKFKFKFFLWIISKTKITLALNCVVLIDFFYHAKTTFKFRPSWLWCITLILANNIAVAYTYIFLLSFFACTTGSFKITFDFSYAAHKTGSMYLGWLLTTLYNLYVWITTTIFFFTRGRCNRPCFTTNWFAWYLTIGGLFCSLFQCAGRHNFTDKIQSVGIC